MRENPPNFNSHRFLQQKVHRGRSSITRASQGFSMRDLFAKYGIEHVDFMNIGIESASFFCLMILVGFTISIFYP